MHIYLWVKLHIIQFLKYLGIQYFMILFSFCTYYHFRPIFRATNLLVDFSLTFPMWKVKTIVVIVFFKVGGRTGTTVTSCFYFLLFRWRKKNYD